VVWWKNRLWMRGKKGEGEFEPAGKGRRRPSDDDDVKRGKKSGQAGSQAGRPREREEK
jgi:hypothetical protein